MSFGAASRQSAADPSSLWLGWLAYACFVTYGSLVPLDFHPRPLTEAWAAFQHIPMLVIGVEGRADWIANCVLYVPLAFLTASLVRGDKPSARRLLALVGSVIFCCVLAVTIEFTQLFFPPRTVSMNDIIAECLGSIIGMVLAMAWTRRFKGFLAAFSGDAARLWPCLLAAYALTYLVLSLFPYDFLLSHAEIEQKIASGTWGWLFAADSFSGGMFMAVVKLAAEVLAALPFGLLLGRRPSGWDDLSRAFLLGAALGLCIETAQWFLFSGISQGVSVLTRAVGVSAGAMLWRTNWDVTALAARIRRFGLALGALYLFALAAVNGWFWRAWGGVELAAKNFGEVRYLPFYYHYYTTETIALVSLISVGVMYAPIGLLAWAMRAGPLLTVSAAALTACVAEAGKLFLIGAHPDPSDILIAAFAVWAVKRLADQLAGVPTTRAEMPEREQMPRVAAEGHGQRRVKFSAQAMKAAAGWEAADARPPLKQRGAWIVPSGPGYAGLLAALLLVGWGVASFPFHPLLLGLLLATYAALVWRHPQLLVVAIPAALPVFDLAPWSGRFYFDEFDLLVLASLAVGYARVPAAPRSEGHDKVFSAIIALVGLSFAIGTVRGLLPWQAPDANSFINYHSPYNALRISKGALWAFLLFGLLRRLLAADQDIRRLFARGMVIGLAGTVAVVAWERLAFPGLLDFASDYRVTGPFSQMHIGGADIECFLTMAVPFLVLLLFQTRSLATRIAATALLLGTGYALTVTFSRNGYVAFFVALALVCLAAMVHSSKRWRRIAAFLPVALALAVAVPVFKAPFFQARMDQVGNDLKIRQAHWADALRIRDPGWATTVLGMGIGRYPETHYWRSSEQHAASYRLKVGAGNTFLRLGAGAALYLEQFIDVEPQHNYLLSLDVRSNQPNSGITVAICEKWLLTSFKCVRQTAKAGLEPGKWQHYQKRIESHEIGGHRTVKLALSNADSNAVLDVDNVRLQAEDGRDLIVNGGFSRGLDRWFFSVDSDLPWHVWSLPFDILFDQGWLGVVSLSLLAGLALVRAARGAWAGNLAAGAVLASLSGFLVIGVFATLTDSPRFLLLFLLLTSFGSMRQEIDRI
ncbi:MAG TPA: VanZ family protein [Rhodocyclaceae bacterium]|nr:VanZ family protein [Rhodocyclaceae bacterium]HUY02668.1 VanZ family protein [Rhodocyclaceae bacterium]